MNINYDTSKLPQMPAKYIGNCTGYIYIGKGTNPSIADTYNNGGRFASLCVGNSSLLPLSKHRSVPFNDGFFTDADYFVPEDSSLLAKMFPLDEQQNHTKNPLLTTNELQFLATLNTNECKPENHIKEIECIIIKLTNIQKEQSTSNANTLEQIIIKLRSVSESIAESTSSTTQDIEIVL